MNRLDHKPKEVQMLKCPKCGEDGRWDVVTRKLDVHPYNMHFVVCAGCHVVLNAFEKSYEFNTFFRPLADSIKKIGEKLGLKLEF